MGYIIDSCCSYVHILGICENFQIVFFIFSIYDDINEKL